MGERSLVSCSRRVEPVASQGTSFDVLHTHLGPEAIVLDFVNPAVTLRWLGDERGQHGRDEGGRTQDAAHRANLGVNSASAMMTSDRKNILRGTAGQSTNRREGILKEHSHCIWPGEPLASPRQCTRSSAKSIQPGRLTVTEPWRATRAP